MSEQESSTPVGTEAGTPRSILELMSVPQFDTVVETIRLGENATLVIPFTTAVATVSSHYANYGEMRGYYRCNIGDDSTCDLCRIGNAKKDRHLLPVYDPVDRRVAVLAMSGSRNPEALLPQMVDVIKRHDVEQEAMLVTIVKPTKMTYRVEARSLPEKADRGIEEINTFTESIASRPNLLIETVSTASNDQLRVVPEISASLSLLGD